MADVALPETLSFDEVTEYETLELKIEAGLKTFYEVGDALLAIRDGKLYREEYGTFEDYCEKKWQMKRNYANKLIASAETLNALGTIVPKDELPKNEGQMRALNSFDAELQPAIVRLANGYAKATGKPVTAGMFERVGSVLEEAELTGHVDTGSGESSALFAAIAATEYEATARQKQYQREHYGGHDSQGKVKPEEKVRRMAHVGHNSGENEWYTPPEYIAAALATLEQIDLDPASTAKANETVKARRFFTADDDGLSQAWAGRVWMNPPYAVSLILKFTEKLCLHYDAGEVTHALVLVNNATETAWFQGLAQRASAVCFPRRRVRFLDPLGNPGAPLQGQAVVYLGDNPEAFKKNFQSFGFVL